MDGALCGAGVEHSVGVEGVGEPLAVAGGEPRRSANNGFSSSATAACAAGATAANASRLAAGLFLVGDRAERPRPPPPPQVGRHHADDHRQPDDADDADDDEDGQDAEEGAGPDGLLRSRDRSIISLSGAGGMASTGMGSRSGGGSAVTPPQEGQRP